MMEETPVWLSTLLPCQRESSFDRMLDLVCTGQSPRSVLDEDPRTFSRASYMRWVMSDPDRRQRYYEALEIGAEVIASQMLDIADAIDNPLEDVQRSALRIKTRQYLLGIYSPKRFGTKASQITAVTAVSPSQAAVAVRWQDE